MTPGPRLYSLAGALLSGVLYAASYPPVGLEPLAWVALVPLLIALREVRPAAGAALSLLFATLTCALMATWLPGMIASFFDVAWSTALASSLAVFLFCAVPYAGFGAWVSFRARRGGASPLLVAVAWAACELFRVHGVVETPWALIAFSQVPWLTIVQAADLAGAIGVGMLIVAVNAAVASLVRQEPGARRAALAVAATFALVWLYGVVRLGQDFGSGEPVRVAVLQGGIEREARLDPARFEENLDHYLALTREAERARAELVLWPELALGFPPAARPELWARVAEASRSLESGLLVGAPHARMRLLVNEPVNSAFLVEDGRVTDRHDKVALMPFSETRPEWIPFGRDAFRPGLELRPLASRAGDLGVLLCSEVLLPDLARRLVEGGAQLLANPSNDDWFATPSASDHQIAVAVFRAIENRRPFLRPSTTGRSAILDAHGRVLAIAPYRGPAVLHATVRPADARTLYARLGTFPTGSAASGVVLASIFLLAFVRRRS